MEVKRDSVSIDDIEQLMKYVDWVKNEYAYGDVTKKPCGDYVIIFTYKKYQWSNKEIKDQDC